MHVPAISIHSILLQHKRRDSFENRFFFTGIKLEAFSTEIRLEATTLINQKYSVVWSLQKFEQLLLQILLTFWNLGTATPIEHFVFSRENFESHKKNKVFLWRCFSFEISAKFYGVGHIWTLPTQAVQLKPKNSAWRFSGI